MACAARYCDRVARSDLTRFTVNLHLASAREDVIDLFGQFMVMWRCLSAGRRDCSLSEERRIRRAIRAEIATLYRPFS